MKDKKYILLILMVVILIVIDQLTKEYICTNLYDSSIVGITNLLNITYTENTGGAYGIGSNNVLIFIIANLIIISIIIKFIISKKDELQIHIILCLLLITSGGIANLIDRVFRGFVVDYIDISPLIKFPVFNLADTYVTIGCLILALSIVINLFNKQEIKNNEKI